jgi:hypothetical protein
MERLRRVSKGECGREPRAAKCRHPREHVIGRL